MRRGLAASTVHYKPRPSAALAHLVRCVLLLGSVGAQCNSAEPLGTEQVVNGSRWFALEAGSHQLVACGDLASLSVHAGSCGARGVRLQALPCNEWAAIALVAPAYVHAQGNAVLRTRPAVVPCASRRLAQPTQDRKSVV